MASDVEDLDSREDAGWRPIGAVRDPFGVVSTRIYDWWKRAVTLRLTNGDAAQITFVKGAYSVGGGLTLQIDAEWERESPNAAEAVWKHFENPANGWGIGARDRASNFGLFGNIFLKMIDPPRGGSLVGVEEIIPTFLDEYRCAKRCRDLLVAASFRFDLRREWYKVLTVLPSGRLAGFAPGERAPDGGEYAGVIIHGATNKVPGVPLGIPDLVPAFDLLAMADEMLWAFAERAAIRNSHAWHLVVKDGTQEEIMAQVKALQSQPRSGRIFGTSDRVDLKAEAPSLGSAETVEAWRALRTVYMNAVGLAPHMMADPTDVNRATGQAMNEPVLMGLAARQAEFLHVATIVLQYQAQVAARAFGETPPVLGQVRVIAPDVRRPAPADAADAIQRMSLALEHAVVSHGVDAESARKALVEAAGRMGVTIEEGSGPVIPQAVRDGFMEAFKGKQE